MLECISATNIEVHANEIGHVLRNDRCFRIVTIQQIPKLENTDVLDRSVNSRS